MAATRMTAAGPGRARKGDRGRRPLLIGLGLVVCFLVVNGIVGEHGAFALMRTRAQNAHWAQAVARARAENAQLREATRRLRSDPAAVEDVARRELGFIRQGEKLFIVRDVRTPRKP